MRHPILLCSAFLALYGTLPAQAELRGSGTVESEQDSSEKQEQFDLLNGRCEELSAKTERGELYLSARDLLRLSQAVASENDMISRSKSSASERLCWNRTVVGRYNDQNLFLKGVLRLNGIGRDELFKSSYTKCQTDEEFADQQKFWAGVIRQSQDDIKELNAKMRATMGSLKKTHDHLQLGYLHSVDALNSTDRYEAFAGAIVSQENPYDIQLDRDVVASTDSYCETNLHSHGIVIP